MKYSSTRHATISVNSFQAILEGLASDGGLYIPAFIPVFNLKQLQGLDFRGLMVEILNAYFDEFGKQNLQDLVTQAYDQKFDTEEITPLMHCGELYLLELYHGPTAAFKDIALSILPYLMAFAKQHEQITETTHILTATSGDTGSATLAGFEHVDGFTITVLYPAMGISTIQQRQMTTSSAQNAFVYGLEGNFDDAQKAIKEIFIHASDFKLALSSANSINIGRLIPQVTYYYKAYFDLVRQNIIQLGDEVSFSVPSGNFGNICAAYLAKESGLPIKHLICASNENKVLTDFLKTGTYTRLRPFISTSSPSMDILVSSNLERLLSLMSQYNSALIDRLMRQLTEQGSYQIPDDLLTQIQKTFIGETVDMDTTDSTIQSFYQKTGVIVDPHTAVGIKAALTHQDTEPMIVCATASPFKFPSTVLKALKQPISSNDFDNLEALTKLTHQPCPHRLRQLRHALIRHSLTIKKEALTALIKAKEPHDHD